LTVRPSTPATRPWRQVAIGLTALVVTAVVATYVHIRPGPNRIDHLGFLLIPPDTNSSFFHAVTAFGTPGALLIGSAGASVVACFTGARDHPRALACLVAPSAAAIVNEFCLKPAVGRMYIGELSFASGSTVVVAGVSAAWVLAVPRPWRVVTATAGTLAVVTMVFAVVARLWHYPSDALAGALLAVGLVVLCDGAAHAFSRRPAGARSPGGPQVGGHVRPGVDRGELAGPRQVSAQR
jgi:membrane-associated phospholipid phosphatase